MDTIEISVRESLLLPDEVERINLERVREGLPSYKPLEEVSQEIYSKGVDPTLLETWLTHPDERVVLSVISLHMEEVRKFRNGRGKDLLYARACKQVEVTRRIWFPLMDVMAGRGFWPRKDRVSVKIWGEEFNSDVTTFQEQVNKLVPTVASGLDDDFLFQALETFASPAFFQLVAREALFRGDKAFKKVLLNSSYDSVLLENERLTQKQIEALVEIGLQKIKLNLRPSDCSKGYSGGSAVPFLKKGEGAGIAVPEFVWELVRRVLTQERGGKENFSPASDLFVSAAAVILCLESAPLDLIDLALSEKTSSRELGYIGASVFAGTLARERILDRRADDVVAEVWIMREQNFLNARIRDFFRKSQSPLVISRLLYQTDESREIRSLFSKLKRLDRDRAEAALLHLREEQLRALNLDDVLELLKSQDPKVRLAVIKRIGLEQKTLASAGCV